jgi:lactoylglutathione lyase
MKATFKNAWGYQGDNMNLPVADVETAVPFYEKTMGFRVVDAPTTPSADAASTPPRAGGELYKTAVLERDDIRIGLAENGGDPTQDGCAFEVDDVEAAFAEFKANGLQKEISEFETENHEDGSEWKVFFVVAPDGLCYWFGQRVK